MGFGRLPGSATCGTFSSMTRSENRTPVERPRLLRGAPQSSRQGGEWGDELRNRLRLLLRTTGVSQREFGRRCGVEPGRVTEWLTGKHLPGAESLHHIADAFGVCLNWLLCGEGGEGPIYRAQTRQLAELAEDVAAYMEREVAARVGDAWPDGQAEPLVADAAQVLESAVSREAAALRTYLAEHAAADRRTWEAHAEWEVEHSLLSATTGLIARTMAAGGLNERDGLALLRWVAALPPDREAPSCACEGLNRPAVFPLSSLTHSDIQRDAGLAARAVRVEGGWVEYAKRIESFVGELYRQRLARGEQVAAEAILWAVGEANPGGRAC